MCRIIAIACLVVCGAAGPVAAQAPEKKNAPDDLLKPAVPAPTDSPIRKLQKERFNERLEMYKQYREYRTEPRALRGGNASVAPVVELVWKLAENGAELEPTLAGRVRWYEFRVQELDLLERLLTEILNSGMPGSVTRFTVSQVKIARIDAEIELIKLKESLKDGK